MALTKTHSHTHTQYTKMDIGLKRYRGHSKIKQRPPILHLPD